MQHGRLGRTGTVVTNYCLGTMTFGAEADEQTSFGMLDDYFAAGGNFIDTADVYGAGVSEEIVGRWLKARPGEARQAVLATKARLPMGEGPNELGLSRRYLSRALDASLKRLGVDCVDLYQLHSWDPLTPVEETLRFLDDAISAGKIVYYGLSNYLGYQVTKVVYEARLANMPLPVTLQPQYNLLAREIELEAVPACLDAGIGLLPWSPLAGGWLTGKYARGATPGSGSRIGQNPSARNEAYAARSAAEQTWTVLDVLSEIAAARGTSRAQVALAWLAGRPAVTSVILGARTRQQLADNLAAAGLALSGEEAASLDAASRLQVGDYLYSAVGTFQRGRRLAGGWGAEGEA